MTIAPPAQTSPRLKDSSDGGEQEDGVLDGRNEIGQNCGFRNLEARRVELPGRLLRSPRVFVGNPSFAPPPSTRHRHHCVCTEQLRITRVFADHIAGVKAGGQLCCSRRRVPSVHCRFAFELSPTCKAHSPSEVAGRFRQHLVAHALSTLLRRSSGKLGVLQQHHSRTRASARGVTACIGVLSTSSDRSEAICYRVETHASIDPPELHHGSFIIHITS